MIRRRGAPARGAAKVAAAVALVVAALTASSADPATLPPIAIGSTGPLSTSAGTVLRGAAAYFRYVNAHGGVAGRSIAFTALDDAGDPTRAAANAQQLADAGTLAFFSVVGDDGGAAVAKVAAATGVPQLFAASGTGPRAYGPTDAAQGAVLARRLLSVDGPGVRVAVVAADDLDGRSLVGGFRHALGTRARTLIVDSTVVDPATIVADDLVKVIQADSPRVLCLFGLGASTRSVLAAAAARGWTPQVYLDADSAWAARLGTAEGTVTAWWSRGATPWPPGDPAADLARRVANAGLGDPRFVAGMAAAYSLVDALRHAGPSPTSRALRTAALHLVEASNPFLLPGIDVYGSATAPAVTQVALLERHDGHWEQLGGLQTAR